MSMKKRLDFDGVGGRMEMNGERRGAFFRLWSRGSPRFLKPHGPQKKLTHHAKHKTGHNMPSIRCNKHTNTYIMCISLSTTREHKAQA